MRNRKAKLKTKDEVRAVRTTLTRLQVLCSNYKTIDELKFAIALMKAELKETESIMEISEFRQRQKIFNEWVENYMTCRWGPCHKCHHLNNGCYEPTQEMVEEIKRRWEQNNDIQSNV